MHAVGAVGGRTQGVLEPVDLEGCGAVGEGGLPVSFFDARQLFYAEQPGGDWHAWIERFNTPPNFLYTERHNGACVFAEPIASDGRGAADTWKIWYASGDINALMDRAPYPLKYLCYKRAKNQTLHFYEWDRIRRLARIRR